MAGVTSFPGAVVPALRALYTRSPPGIRNNCLQPVWLDHAHRRYLSAIRTLAQVRKLLVPVVQVNIADRQVNVGAMVPQPGLEP